MFLKLSMTSIREGPRIFHVEIMKHLVKNLMCNSQLQIPALYLKLLFQTRVI